PSWARPARPCCTSAASSATSASPWSASLAPRGTRRRTGSAWRPSTPRTSPATASWTCSANWPTARRRYRSGSRTDAALPPFSPPPAGACPALRAAGRLPARDRRLPGGTNGRGPSSARGTAPVDLTACPLRRSVRPGRLPLPLFRASGSAACSVGRARVPAAPAVPRVGLGRRLPLLPVCESGPGRLPLPPVRASGQAACRSRRCAGRARPPAPPLFRGSGSGACRSRRSARRARPPPAAPAGVRIRPGPPAAPAGARVELGRLPLPPVVRPTRAAGAPRAPEVRVQGREVRVQRRHQLLHLLEQPLGLPAPALPRHGLFGLFGHDGLLGPWPPGRGPTRLTPRRHTGRRVRRVVRLRP